MTTTPTTNICRCPCCHKSMSRVIVNGRCSQCGHVPGAVIEPTAAEVAAAAGEKRLTRVQKRRMDRFVKKEIEKKKRETGNE